MPFLLYVRPLSVFNLIHHNMKLIVEVFFLIQILFILGTNYSPSVLHS